ncbi:MAG TPA: hypothetical protein VF439_01170 [Candidatus Paceibacterota bacterium]
MKLYRTAFAAATAAALILPFTPAFAADISGNTAVSVGIDASVGAGSTTSAGAAMDADADMTESSSSSDTDMNASSTGGLVTGVTTAVTGSLMLTRSDADASGTSVTMTDAAAVSTDGDLDAYAHGILASDDHIRRIDSASDHVALTYDERGWLFGFIPTTVEATASVNADGTQQVSYPWYRFLMATNKDDVQAGVNSVVHTSMTDGTMDMSGSLSAGAQARILGSLHSAMQSAYETSATASGSASTSAGTGY